MTIQRSIVTNAQRSMQINKSNRGKQQVVNDLKQRSLKAPFWSWTVSRLMCLPKDRYEAFLKLFDHFHRLSQKNEFPMVFELVLPKLSALLTINVKHLLDLLATAQGAKAAKAGKIEDHKLIQAVGAARDITTYCYLTGENRVDLRPLADWINSKYLP